VIRGKREGGHKIIELDKFDKSNKRNAKNNHFFFNIYKAMMNGNAELKRKINLKKKHSIKNKDKR